MNSNKNKAMNGMIFFFLMLENYLKGSVPFFHFSLANLDFLSFIHLLLIFTYL